MRKFSASKFYKLLRAAVIIASIMSFLLAYISFNAYKQWEKMYIGDAPKSCKLLSDSEIATAWSEPNNTTLNSLLREENNCYKTFRDGMGTTIKSFYAFLGLGIGVPIIFFGGVSVLKYIFPITKNNS